MQNYPNSTPVEVFARRRRRLLETIDGVAILRAAPQALRNRDSYYPYRYDSYFWYLTGFTEPDAALVLISADSQRGEAAQSIFFCQPKNAEKERWKGYRYGPQAASEAFAFDAAYPIEELEKRLPDLLANHQNLWYTMGADHKWDSQLAEVLQNLRTQARQGKRAPYCIRDVSYALDALRQIKEANEIQLMQRAADITCQAHERVMRVCQPGMAEYQLEAELTHAFRYAGADGHAYPPIVAGGANACVLHYVNNNAPLPDDAMVLIDAGCELEGYAADVTRTFPVNGVFSAAQRDCYEIVLAAQAAAIAAIVPGAPFHAGHQAALRVLAQGMIDLGLLQGSVDAQIESAAYQRFYMHRTSHWLGLDVHDAGLYHVGDESLPLSEGMVMTVEPGLYIPNETDLPPALAGVGIRIEDDVRVGKQGGEVYSNAAKQIADIEDLMRATK